MHPLQSFLMPVVQEVEEWSGALAAHHDMEKEGDTAASTSIASHHPFQVINLHRTAQSETTSLTLMRNTFRTASLIPFLPQFERRTLTSQTIPP